MSAAGSPPEPGSSAAPVTGTEGGGVRHAVIMAGGSGTRLWPLSRAARPKQLLDVVAEDGGGAHSLLAEAFDRVRAVLPPERIWVCTAARYGEQVRAALPELGADRLILEPVARDTANAVGLAAALVADLDPDAELAVVSADHVIRPVERFAAALGTAYDVLAGRPGALVTLGITPTGPATGFGYVQRGAATGVPGAFEAAAFREKPDLATAEEYLASGEYLWNSGMFVWRAQTVLDALADHLPESAEGLAKIVAVPAGPERDAVLAAVFPTLPKISVDYAVLEPAATEPGRVLVVDLDVDWLDVGSWPALAGTLETDAEGNAVRGTAVLLDSSGNVVFSDDPDHLIALVGVRDSVVVHTGDVTMVCSMADAERVKQLLAEAERRHGTRFS
jgi:mannose-1-phosphate guanylyltransferase